jgi:hypothetical protein
MNIERHGSFLISLNRFYGLAVSWLIIEIPVDSWWMDFRIAREQRV